MPANNPSSQIVEQRIRNLIIGYVQMVAHYRAGEMPGLMEIICMWEDYVLRPLTSYQHQFHPPVYTVAERIALETVDEAWAAFADSTTIETIYEDEPVALAKPEWIALVASAAKAADVMFERGKLPED